MKNKVLVIGSNLDKCKKIVEETISTKLEWKIDDGFCKGSSFILDTKYYTAAIEFWVHIDKQPPFDELGSIVDSIIFTFESSKSESWDMVVGWLPFTTEYNPSNLVCVSLTPTNTSLETYQDWCSQNFVEFIEGHKKGENEETREKLGVDRILESLHSVMWNNMEMKNQNKNEKKAPVFQDLRLMRKNEEEFTNIHGSNRGVSITMDQLSLLHLQQENNNSIFDGLVIEEKELNIDEEIKQQEKEGFVNIGDDKVTYNAIPDKKENNNNNPKYDISFIDDLKNPDEDFDLEKAMMEMMSLKQMASSLPFEQRKQMAAEVALRFSKLLFEDEDGDDDEDLTVDDLLS